ncbi:hypothetical protein QJS04_geneDACA006538 [Acorus gramineus]|uniref:Uncharacterized protein n=1 Tax=Acorus gramineus TaxID=55184 RepID=A0AAV9AVK1_ACOGR|nr:hypothetical protein QJS04_geneDACA006538 [Acorus gramineus]
MEDRLAGWQGKLLSWGGRERHGELIGLILISYDPPKETYHSVLRGFPRTSDLHPTTMVIVRRRLEEGWRRDPADKRRILCDRKLKDLLEHVIFNVLFLCLLLWFKQPPLRTFILHGCSSGIDIIKKTTKTLPMIYSPSINNHLPTIGEASFCVGKVWTESMGSGTFRFRRLNRLEKDICNSLDIYLDACEVPKDIDCFSGPQNDLRYKPNGDYPTEIIILMRGAPTFDFFRYHTKFLSTVVTK